MGNDQPIQVQGYTANRPLGTSAVADVDGDRRLTARELSGRGSPEKLRYLRGGSSILDQLVQKVVKPPERYRTVQDKALYVLEKLWVKFTPYINKVLDGSNMSQDSISLALKKLKDEKKPDGKPVFSQIEIGLLETLIFASRQAAAISLNVQKAMLDFERAVSGSEQYTKLLSDLFVNDHFSRAMLQYDLDNLSQVLGGAQSQTDKTMLGKTMEHAINIISKMISDYLTSLSSDKDKADLVKIKELLEGLLKAIEDGELLNGGTKRIDLNKLGLVILPLKNLLEEMKYRLPDMNFAPGSVLKEHWESTESARRACLSGTEDPPDSLFWFDPQMTPQEMVALLTPGEEKKQLQESIDNQARDLAKKLAISEEDAKCLVDNKEARSYYISSDIDTYLRFSSTEQDDRLRDIMDRIALHSKVLRYGSDGQGNIIGVTCVDEAGLRLNEVLVKLQEEMSNDAGYRDALRKDFRSKFTALFSERQWDVVINAMKEKGFLKTDAGGLKQYFAGKDPKALNDALTAVLDAVVNNLKDLKFDDNGVPSIEWKVLIEAMNKDLPAETKNALGAFLNAVFNFVLNSKDVTNARLGYEQARLGEEKPPNAGSSWDLWEDAKDRTYTKDGNNYGPAIYECMQNLLNLRWADMLDRVNK